MRKIEAPGLDDVALNPPPVALESVGLSPVALTVEEAFEKICAEDAGLLKRLAE